MKVLTMVAALGALVLFAPLVEARSVVRVGESVAVATEQVAEGDLYAVGQAVAISGKVAGDAQLLGLSTTLNGSVASDTLMVGGVVSVAGEVGDDVRVVGGDVTVSGTIIGDLFVIGGTLTVLSSAKIEGDIIFFGQEADIAGTVGHDVMGNATTWRLDGPIAGGVDITTSQLTLGERAAVARDVRYVSHQELTRAPAASVTGSVVRNDPLLVADTGVWQTLAIFVLTVLFAALSWYVLLRRSLEDVIATTTTATVRSGLIGLAIIFVVPFLATVLVVSQLGALVGLILVALLIFLLLLAAVGVVPVVGNAVRYWTSPQQSFGIIWLGVGGLIVAGCLLASAWFAVVLFLALTVTLGALTERLYAAVR
jgi:cytoskeletal protein CcmA (bactofilin family)